MKLTVGILILFCGVALGQNVTVVTPHGSFQRPATAREAQQARTDRANAETHESEKQRQEQDRGNLPERIAELERRAGITNQLRVVER